MTTQIEGVEVELGRLDADWRKFGIKVKVRSRRKPGLKTIVEVDPGKVVDQNGLVKLVALAGASCAEQLGKKYKDNIDPVKAGTLAVQAFGEECRLMAALSQSNKAKLGRLTVHKASLNDNERELVDRLDWLTRRGDDMTPKEGAALDNMVARLHGRQLG